MPFDTTQLAYRDLREIFAQRTDPIVAWVGAGLSVPAGLPTWAELKAILLKELEATANRIDDRVTRQTVMYKAGLAKVERNYWTAFSILQDSLGLQTYTTLIRRSMQMSERAVVPEIYRDLWKLGIRGMLNLNIDHMAKRAFSEVFPGKILHEFAGTNIGPNIHLQRASGPWLAHLHGNVDDRGSWVFTTSELQALFNDKGYQSLITASLTTRTVVFIGVSADDTAAGGHLANLAAQNVDCGGHFWITHRKDIDTRAFAEKAGIRVILYSDENNHAELAELVTDLRRYVPRDDETTPVKPSLSLPLPALPAPSEIARLTSSEIRQILNSHAAAILCETTPDSVKAFEEFAQKYEDAIYRGWRVTPKAPNNVVLQYTILDKNKDGAFGDVFRAEDSSGNQVAIKVLHERVRDNLEMLHCFRRGVRSMKILTEQNVHGVVKCFDASEIPAVVVMEFIEGIDLQEAVPKGVLRSWHKLLWVSAELTKIIRASHRLPQRVLHRDIRPANIMLENCWGPDPDWAEVRLCVLDFDLSWHLDSMDVSVSQPGTSNGYLSPEQAERNSGVSTRNAAVDSFGTGMTFYFLASGEEPKFGQHRYGDWKATLKHAAQKRPCREWISLPERYFRLVLRATLDRQADRVDMAQIENEISRLQEVLRDPRSVRSAELVAEELASRVAGASYEWDAENQLIRLTESHAMAQIRFNEAENSVTFEFRSYRRDFELRKNVKRWLPTAIDKAAACLRDAGWIAKIDAVTETPGFTAVIDLPRVRELGLDTVAAGIVAGITALTFT